MPFRNSAPDSCNNSTIDIDPRGSDILSLARGGPISQAQYDPWTVIGQIPSLPLSALNLTHPSSRGGQCLSCIVHRHTPRLKPPTCIPLFRVVALLAPCLCPWYALGFQWLPCRSVLDETLPEEAVQGRLSNLDAPLRSSTSLGTSRRLSCHAAVA